MNARITIEAEIPVDDVTEVTPEIMADLLANEWASMMVEDLDAKARHERS